MTESLVWLVAVVALYGLYCLLWGVSSARLAQGPQDFFLAGRRVPAWIFVLFATGGSFGGWAMMGYPALVMRDGFQFAQLGLVAVTVPLTGVLFFKRQWLLSKLHGYITPGEMLSDYFGGDTLRIMVVGIALVCAVPYVGLQLSASGALVEWLSHGTVPGNAAMWAITLVVFLYLCIGGFRAAVYVGGLQGLLLCTGILSVSLLALWNLGGVDGFDGFMQGLSKLGASTAGPWGGTAQGYNAYFAIPGVVQFTAGVGKELPVAGLWTAAMVLSTCFAFMGLQATPAFSMLAYSCKSPKGFAPQQVWAAAAGVGVLLVFFSVISGLGANFLGASSVFNDVGLSIARQLPQIEAGQEARLYAQYLLTLAESSPWFMALLAVCALGAIHAMVALFVTTTGTIIVRDVFVRYLTPLATLEQQKLYARCSIAAIMGSALLLATFAPQAQVLLAALALGFAVQLWPSLAGVCWFPWITRQGVTVGLIAGMSAVVLTEPLGGQLVGFFGISLPWGRWPWTIHSAGWGIVVNIVCCVVVSWISNHKADRAHRLGFHRVYSSTVSMPSRKRFLRPVAWSLTLVWFFFAVGPGAVLGNDLLGAPSGGMAAWLAGVPSLWIWQMVWWALGVLVVWFLAYALRMSTVPSPEQMDTIARSQSDAARRLPVS
jgi:Na+/proline symporter